MLHQLLANDQRCGKTAETDEDAAEAILDFIHKDCKVIKRECRASVGRFELSKYICQIEKLFDGVLT